MLKVGELARQTGLTVRSLHHYDQIGLVTPSARSAAGYRLYAPADVRRLQSVQALRDLGFGLARIAEMLAQPVPEGAPLQQIEAQLREVDAAIARSRQVREQLSLLLQTVALDEAASAEAAPWQRLLELLPAFSAHFSARELRSMLRRWQQLCAQWQPLIAEVEALRRAGAAADAPQLQRLAQQWMDQSMRLTRGNLALALRWARMHEQAPETARHQGIAPATLQYIGRAIALRMEALRRHLDAEQLMRLDAGLSARWQQWAARAQSLLDQGAEVRQPAARHLLAQWQALLARMAGQDPQLQAAIVRAYASEPLLQHGHPVTPEMRALVQRIGDAGNDTGA
ncbi:MerR family transcriptional regulator [Comamonas guangdongensis]|uniref:MerR family transcriptional regulator n=1 Tax=Comamonas guangdongensis TaxID=510515 RepID=A0ABV3ZVE4_9BURK